MTGGRIARSLLLLLALLGVAMALGIWLGETPLDTGALLRGDTIERAIVDRRIQRVILAAIVGAALATCGVALQALVENPLAEPFVLGLSGGAAVGATAALAAGASFAGALGGALVGTSAFAGALVAFLVVFALGRVRGALVPERLVLVGVVFNAFATALVLAFQSVAPPSLKTSMLDWLMGTLGSPADGLRNLAALATIGGVVLLTWKAPVLNLLSLGELDAHGLGVDVRRERRTVFIACAVLVGAAVSLSGVVGFVGLVVPHLVRLGFGGDHRLSVPATALAGASFLVLADLGTRLLFPLLHTLPPVGMVTALLGAPLFLHLLAARTRRSES